MPMRSMTARDREFSTDVNEMISASSSRSNPTRNAARATSTHGENGRTCLRMDKPTKPINTLDDSTSTAQLLHPRSANCDRHASILASLASRDWSDAKNSMTSASAFIAANGARSDSRHWRSRRRAVSISMALGTVAPYMPARLDECRQLRECHLPANFIVSGRHAWWQPFVHGEQVGTAVAISKRDRHLAAKRRLSGLVRHLPLRDRPGV